MATVTNRRTVQALKGQSTWVLLNASDSGVLSGLFIGQEATVDSSSNVGYVSRIDLYGHSFQITPNMLNSFLESETVKGYLIASETITLE